MLLNGLEPHGTVPLDEAHTAAGSAYERRCNSVVASRARWDPGLSLGCTRLPRGFGRCSSWPLLALSASAPIIEQFSSKLTSLDCSMDNKPKILILSNEAVYLEIYVPREVFLPIWLCLHTLCTRCTFYLSTIQYNLTRLCMGSF